MVSVQGQCLVTLEALCSAVLEKQQSRVRHRPRDPDRVWDSGLEMVGGWDCTLMTKAGFQTLGQGTFQRPGICLIPRDAVTGQPSPRARGSDRTLTQAGCLLPRPWQLSVALPSPGGPSPHAHQRGPHGCAPCGAPPAHSCSGWSVPARRPGEGLAGKGAGGWAHRHTC